MLTIFKLILTIYTIGYDDEDIIEYHHDIESEGNGCKEVVNHKHKSIILD